MGEGLLSNNIIYFTIYYQLFVTYNNKDRISSLQIDMYAIIINNFYSKFKKKFEASST